MLILVVTNSVFVTVMSTIKGRESLTVKYKSFTKLGSKNAKNVNN